MLKFKQGKDGTWYSYESNEKDAKADNQEPDIENKTIDVRDSDTQPPKRRRSNK